MAIQPGRHLFGPTRGRITLRTSRDGLAAQAGHDLTIEVSRWSGQLAMAEDGSPTELRVRAELGSLLVREGSGGLKPLTDRDKREIAVTARNTLRADRYPEATFAATGFEPGADGGGVIEGTLALAGQSRSERLEVSQTGPDRYRATATVHQTDFGIKPYSAFLGSLKVSDAVRVEVEVDLSGGTQQEAAG
jgi:polyisoprenoid-binding protein YceI